MFSSQSWTPQTAALRHGHTSNRRATPTYCSWSSMVQRCTNPNCKSWPEYGGRGITVCDRWRNSFDAFLADMGQKPRGTSIDRIDNDRGYEPGNCRWATRAVQNKNQRRNRRQLSPHVERDIVARIERGHTHAAVAASLGIARVTVGEVWKRLRPGQANPNRGRAVKDRR